MNKDSNNAVLCYLKNVQYSLPNILYIKYYSFNNTSNNTVRIAYLIVNRISGNIHSFKEILFKQRYEGLNRGV